MEECVATVGAMLRQEERYRTRDFLRERPSCTTLSAAALDADARSAIACWSIRVMKACHYQSDTAMIAIDYLDRFVATDEGRGALLDRRQYQVASLSCVYCAIKLHENRRLEAAVVAKLSNGEISDIEITNMEINILHALEWRMNPPTAMLFVRSILDESVLGDEINSLGRQALLDVSELQVVASLPRYEFVAEKRSMVGLAALLNAAESVCDDGSLVGLLENVIHHCTKLTHDDLVAVRIQLYECIASKEVSASSLPTLRKPSYRLSPCSKTRETTCLGSPRTVAAVVTWNRGNLME